MKSRYIVEQKYDDNHLLLYSTVTGQFVIINETVYKEIVSGSEEHSKHAERLRQLGFSVDCDEQQLLENNRKKTIQNLNLQPVTNYVITPTMNCNARCAYCFESGSHHDDMSMDVAKNVVNFIVTHHKGAPIAIHWFGGEPLMRTDIIDYISNELHARNVKFVSKITSNGYLIDKEVLNKALKKWNVQIIQITLDDVEKQYDAIKQYVDVSSVSPFQRVLGNIELCLKHNLPVRIRINYNPVDIDKVKDIMCYVLDCFDNHPLLSFHPQAIFSDDETIPGISGSFSTLHTHPFMRLRQYEQECNARRDKNNPVHAGSTYLKQFIPWCNYRVTANTARPYDKILKKYYLLPIPIHCAGICDNSVAIDSHGDIFVCQRLLGQSVEYASGNVVDGIVRNDMYQYYQSSTLTQKKCHHCVLLPVCQGGCKFKHYKYKTNQGCLPIKGIIRQTVRRAAEEVEEKYGIERIGE